MFVYLYTLDYEDSKLTLPTPSEIRDQSDNALEVNAHMYTMGD